jgi:membrane associated rhomboid family serine protease
MGDVRSNSVARNYLNQAPVTTALGIVMTVIFLITAVQSHSITQPLTDSRFGDYLILYGPVATLLPEGISHVVGSMFLHVSISHLAVNLFMLIFIGREVERYFGGLTYAWVFLAGGVGAAAAVVWFDYATPTAGASGALYALMTVLIAIAIKRKTDLRAPIVLLLVNLGFTFITPGVSLWGHVGGLVAGLAMSPAVFIHSGKPAMLGYAIRLVWIVVIFAFSWLLIMLKGLYFAGLVDAFGV